MGQSRASTHLATWDTISLMLSTYTVCVQEYVVYTFIYSFHFKHLPDTVIQSDYIELYSGISLKLLGLQEQKLGQNALLMLVRPGEQPEQPH